MQLLKFLGVALLVLVHGTSASLHSWDGWAQALQGRHRVIRVDLPGFGLTGPAPDRDYSLPAYAGFIVQVMDRLGVQQAVLAGNSIGGAVAWKTAVDHPARVGKLLLWGTQDRLIPPSQAQLFARDIPGSQVPVFEGLGHVPHEEDPARTVAAVQAFLEQRG